MPFFYLLFLKIIPLYLNILLGYLAGRFFGVQRDSIAKLMFYLINPLIIFNGVLAIKLDASILSLPFFTLTISCLLCLLFYFLARKVWKDNSANLVAFNAGSGNMGYFGLPLAIILFDNQGEGIYLMSILGITLYENSLGFYVAAKGTHSAKECLIKILTLPSIYAFIAALALNPLHLPIPEPFADFMCHIKGAYTVLGMMIVGLGLAALTSLKIDFKFISLTFFAKFVVWPIIILSFIYFDKYYLNLFDQAIYGPLALLSIVPLAVNSVVIASILKMPVEKTAAAVFLSILFALIYVPIMILFFILEPSHQFFNTCF